MKFLTRVLVSDAAGASTRFNIALRRRERAPHAIFAALMGVAWLSATAFAQPLALPLEIRQPDTLWNFQSQRGVPISTVSNVPPGSDGRMTNYNESGSALLPTTNQFASL